MIGHQIGNLKIISKIGEGGMGSVYLAENLKLGNQFAVKSLGIHLVKNQLFRERFSREAKAQARLDHQNIAKIIDFIEEVDNLYIVMEYIEGESLEELIRKKKRFLEKECLEIVKGVLRGLNYAHMKGIVHRDIKPSNIMITNEGVPKIMDFGIALVSGEKKITKTGFAIGTLHYMSPEQIKGRELDHRSDVYSMGIVLYEMLTGAPPF